MCFPSKSSKEGTTSVSAVSRHSVAQQVKSKKTSVSSEQLKNKSKQSAGETSGRSETVEDKTQKEEDDGRRLGEVYKALGVEGNNDRMARILKEQVQQRKKHTPPAVKNPAEESKSGDIVYQTPMPRKAKKSSSEDTLYERKKGKKYSYNSKGGGGSKELPRYGASAETIEEEEPNERNFMWNQKDMQYVAHDMMYTFNQKMIPSRPPEKKKLNPWGSLEVLDKDPAFGWNAFKVNTLLSNALTLPTENEVLAKGTKKKGDRHVQWIEPAATVLKVCESRELSEGTAKEFNNHSMRTAE